MYFWFVPIPLAWILMKVARRGKPILPTTSELRDYAKGERRRSRTCSTRARAPARGAPGACHDRRMTQQFARMPADAGEVVRQVRGIGGVPWWRLFGYLRPHLAPFSVALVGLLVGSGSGSCFPLVDRRHRRARSSRAATRPGSTG